MLTAATDSFGSCSAAATLLQSGFVISASSSSLTSILQSGQNQQSALTVFSVALDASLTPIAYQPLASGTGTVSVPVDSSDKTIGTATTPVTFTAGQQTGQTIFTSLSKAGPTNVTISAPSGFSAPSQNTFVTVTVQTVVMSVCGGRAKHPG